MASVALFLTWICLLGCVMESPAEEVELFNSVKETSLGWTSDPPRDWVEMKLKLGLESTIPTFQSCSSTRRRTLLSSWIDRKHGHHLFLDIVFALEEEPSNRIQFLHVHLFDSDSAFRRFLHGYEVLSLQASKLLPSVIDADQIPNYLMRNRSLSLGPVTATGFQLGFSYSGTCAMINSVRLYYISCRGLVRNLARFEDAAGGSGLQIGACVEGAVQLSVPTRECQGDGAWGRLLGGCVCAPGHEKVGETCKVCSIGYFKPTNESGGCRLCPPKSTTGHGGAERCDCLQGYYRLPSDPDLLGCTKPPSAPVNVTADRHSSSVLGLLWDPPHDLGGREEVMYSVGCVEKRAETSSQWEQCREDVFFLPGSANLTTTAVNITGLNGFCDYRLHIRARNALSIYHGATAGSEAVITVHRWNIPMILTAAPVQEISVAQMVPAPRADRKPLPWLGLVVAMAGLLFLVIIFSTACSLHRHYSKNTFDPMIELVPINPGMAFRRAEEPEPGPDSRAEGGNGVEWVVQLLGPHSSRLLENLKEALVERRQLTLGKELGKGEFGSVYEGIFTSEENVDIRVAVKTIRVGIYTQEDLHEFLREAEIMRSFDHENVIRLLGVTLERGDSLTHLPVPLVILPFMKHGDLRRFIIATRYGDIPMSLLRFMVDIAAGMDYLSSHGFLHRDLAARNCMLGDNLRVCVADFGLSKNVESSDYYRQKETARVPVKWMAMESLSESKYSTKSDVWAFGVTMWEIVSRGRTPYPGVQNHELLDLLMTGQRLKQPEDCGSELYEVMCTCWSKDPNKRPGFAALGETLKGLLSVLPPLEASEEAYYINQGLEAAACQDVGHSCASEMEETAAGNVYMPAPSCAPPAANRDLEENLEEDNYLLFINSGSAVEGD